MLIICIGASIAQALESSDTIPLGSVKKLRQQARLLNKAEVKSVNELHNALRHVVSLDAFLPSSQASDQNAELQSRPVLIATTDEERKQ